MKQLIAWITDHIFISALITCAVVLAFSINIGVLEIDYSSESLMVENDPAREYYEKMKGIFGSETITVVVVKSDEIFTSNALKAIEALTNEFQNLDGVKAVTSLATVDRIKGEGEILYTDKLITYIPESPAELQRIKEDALSNYIFVDNIISKDTKSAAINIYTDASNESRDFYERFSRKVDEIISPYQNEFDIYQLGDPLIQATFVSYLMDDIITLVPITMIVSAIILVISLRTVLGVILPLVTAGLSILCTFGFMSYMGYSLNVITIIIPPILLICGSGENIYMISEYYLELRQGREKTDAIKGMGAKCGLPLLLTASTTILAFLSLHISKIAVVKQFSITGAFGLTANFLFTIMLTPVILKIFPIPRAFKGHFDGDKQARWSLINSLFDKIAQINLNKKTLIIALMVFFSVSAAWGCFRLKVDSDYAGWFRQDSPIRKRFSDMHKNLSGGSIFYIIAETDMPDKAKDPAVLNQIVQLQRYLDQTQYFDKVISVTDYLMLLNREMHGGDESYQVIPDSKALIAQYFLLMEESGISKFLDNDYSKINVVVRHNITRSWQLNKALQEVRNYIDKNFSKDLKVSFTGETILINRASKKLIRDCAVSFSLIIIPIFLIAAFIFLSFKAGLFSVIPNAIPILLSYGLMGWLGIPISVTTSMIAAICFGVTVDNTIHFMIRYNHELKITRDRTLAMHNTLKTKGRPMIITALALAFGFTVLTFSHFGPIHIFGLLSAFIMIAGLINELFVTPWLVMLMRPITLWDMITTKINKKITDFSPLFKGLKRAEAKKVVILGGLKSFSKGDLIIKQGEKGKELYMTVLGKLKVYTEKEGRQIEIATLSEGDIVGEMGAISQAVRSANVVALEDTELLLIDEQTLERIGRRIPKTAAKLFLNIAKILSQRLREAGKGALYQGNYEEGKNK